MPKLLPIEAPGHYFIYAMPIWRFVFPAEKADEGEKEGYKMPTARRC